MEQRLPLPVGGRRPVRRMLRAFRGRRRGGRLLSLAGLGAAAAGAALGAAPAPFTAGLDTGGYHVGAFTLAARGGGVYAGPAGALVVAERSGGAAAGASTRLDGVPTVGACQQSRDAERCWFELGGHRLEAADRLRDGGWDRRYDDGRQARIELAGGRPIPVPIPLGR